MNSRISSFKTNSTIFTGEKLRKPVLFPNEMSMSQLKLKFNFFTNKCASIFKDFNPDSTLSQSELRHQIDGYVIPAPDFELWLKSGCYISWNPIIESLDLTTSDENFCGLSIDQKIQFNIKSKLPFLKKNKESKLSKKFNELSRIPNVVKSRNCNYVVPEHSTESESARGSIDNENDINDADEVEFDVVNEIMGIELKKEKVERWLKTLGSKDSFSFADILLNPFQENLVDISAENSPEETSELAIRKKSTVEITLGEKIQKGIIQDSKTERLKGVKKSKLKVSPKLFVKKTNKQKKRDLELTEDIFQFELFFFYYSFSTDPFDDPDVLDAEAIFLPDRRFSSTYSSVNFLFRKQNLTVLDQLIRPVQNNSEVKPISSESTSMELILKNIPSSSSGSGSKLEAKLPIANACNKFGTVSRASLKNHNNHTDPNSKSLYIAKNRSLRTAVEKSLDIVQQQNDLSPKIEQNKEHKERLVEENSIKEKMKSVENLKKMVKLEDEFKKKTKSTIKLKEIIGHDLTGSKPYVKCLWTDNPFTKKKYSPSWEPLDNLSCSSSFYGNYEQRRRVNLKKYLSSKKTLKKEDGFSMVEAGSGEHQITDKYFEIINKGPLK
ncbi:unnamed protein product [Brachionus calyciflorus]|uniref:Uncharacterized protein n=1 Tax=Brachionus calyciflorus TaxID=104777 RepID=A0A813VI72_9BILA|nr:unnamed protein product [Brachionus calyciflorus]